MLGEKVGLHVLPIDTEWQTIAAPVCCNYVEMTADVDWQWRTNGQACSRGNLHSAEHGHGFRGDLDGIYGALVM